MLNKIFGVLKKLTSPFQKGIKKADRMFLNFLAKHPKIKRFYYRFELPIIIFSTTFLILCLTIAVFLITGGRINTTQDYSDSNLTQLNIVKTEPSIDSPPYATDKPIYITVSKYLDYSIDLSLLQARTEVTPYTQFVFNKDEQNKNRLVLTPTIKLEESIQYKVNIKEGEYGGYYIPDDYEFFFRTEGSGNNSSIGEYTFSWSISKFEEKKTFNFNLFDKPEDGTVENNFTLNIYKSDPETYRETLQRYIDLLNSGEKTDFYSSNSEYKNKIKEFKPNQIGEKIIELVGDDLEHYVNNYGYGFNTDLNLDEAGVYYAEILFNGEYAKNVFILVNEFGLAYRSGYNEGQPEYFLFSQNYKESTRIGVSIEALSFNRESIDLVSQNTFNTDANGLAYYKPENGVSIFFARRENDLAVVPVDTYFYVKDGYYSGPMYYFYHLFASSFGERYEAIIEKEMYQLDEDINLKIIARKYEGNFIKYIQDKPVKVKLGLTNNNDQEFILEKDVVINSEGYAEVNIKGSELPDEQKYPWVSIMVDNYFVRSFQRKYFQKPEYEINISVDKEEYNYQDNVNAAIEVKSYSGSVIDNKEVRLNLSVQKNYYWGNDLRSENNCKSLISALIDSGEFEEYKYETVVRTDANGNAKAVLPLNHLPINSLAKLFITATISDQTNTSTTESVQLDYYPSDRFIIFRNDNTFSIANQNFITNAKIVDRYCNLISSSALKVNISKVEFTDKPGYFYDRTLSTIYDTVITTNNQGLAILEYKFDDPALYEIKISFGDLVTKNEHYVIRKGEVINAYSQSSLQVMLDKDLYQVGETAKVTLIHPGITGDLWMMIDKNVMISNEVIKLNEYITEVSIQITEEMFPYVKIYLSGFLDNGYIQNSIEINVDSSFKTIGIDMQQEKFDFRPGEEVSIRVNTKNLGQNIPANLTIAVVDKSVEDLNDLGRNYGDLLNNFYWSMRRYLDQANSLRPLNIYDPRGGMGAGGGETRDLFVDVAYWNTNIKTDANGEAIIKFTLPDNLTKWVIKIWADDETRFGQDTSYITSNLPLALVTSAPTSIVAEDEFTVNATVYNNTENEEKVTVEFKPEFNITNPLSDNNFEINLLPKSSKSVEWRVKTDTIGENLNYSVSATGKFNTDKLTKKINIKSKEFSYQTFLTGNKFDITIPEDAKNIKSELEFINPFERLIQKTNKAFESTMNQYDATSTASRVLNVAIINDLKNNSIELTQIDQSIYNYRDFSNKFLLDFLQTDTASKNLTAVAYILNSLNSGKITGILDSEEIIAAYSNFIKKNIGNLDEARKLVVYYLASGTDGFNLDFGLMDSNSSNLVDILNLLNAITYNKEIEGISKEDLWAKIKSKIISENGYSFLPYEQSVFATSDLYDIKDNLVSILLLNASIEMNDEEVAKQVMSFLLNFSLGNQDEKIEMLYFDALKRYFTNSNSSILGTVKLKINNQDIKDISIDNSNVGNRIEDIKGLLSIGQNSIEINSDTNIFSSLKTSYTLTNSQKQNLKLIQIDSYIADSKGDKINSLKQGEYALLLTRIATPVSFDNMNLKVFYPAGIEVIDTSLANTSLPKEILNSDLYKYNSKLINPNDLFFTTGVYLNPGENLFVVPVRAKNKGIFHHVHSFLESNVFGVNSVNNNPETFDID